MSYPHAYACINEDEEIRKQSSSGGIFTVIAEKVIHNKGIVFGVCFDADFNVIHKYTDNIDGLAKFRGSKYVQSDLCNTYKQAKEFLDQGRQVLFSGTPCQIAGLKSYIRKDYDNLITTDIICHGTPSPIVWEKYRKELANGKQIESINFRDKSFGWRRFSMKFSFKNSEDYLKDLKTDIYMKGFLSDLYLRSSCYNCKFKSVTRHSDITLGDFWGVEHIAPSFDDNKGTSLILINSIKGEKIFSELEEIRKERIDFKKSISYNQALIRSANANPRRPEFFQKLQNSTSIIELITKYTKISFIEKNIRRLKRYIG